MPFPPFRIRTLMIAVAVSVMPVSRVLAADHPSRTTVPVVVYASLSSQADEDVHFWRPFGVFCSLLYTVVALIPVCRWPMTVRRWVFAVAVVAGVISLELSLYRWTFDEWPYRLWGMLQLPLGIVLGFAVILWYAAKNWLRSTRAKVTE